VNYCETYIRVSHGFQAQVKLKGVVHHLGDFDTVAEAEAAVRAFRAEYLTYSEDAMNAPIGTQHCLFVTSVGI
jgi:hypothetical protein